MSEWDATVRESRVSCLSALVVYYVDALFMLYLSNCYSNLCTESCTVVTSEIWNGDFGPHHRFFCCDVTGSKLCKPVLHASTAF